MTYHVFRILLVVSVFFACSVAKTSFAVSTEDVLKASFENVRLIHSIEFTASFDDGFRFKIPSEGIDTVRKNKGQLRYYQSGDMFRAEAELHNEDGSPKMTFISTFDGKKYQQFSKEQGILEFKETPINSNPNLFSNPIISAYAWLLGYSHAVSGSETMAVFSEIKNLELWERCFADAKIVGEVVERGIPTVVVDFTNEKIDSTMRVWFAKDLQFFPISCIVSSKKTEVPSDDIKIEEFSHLESDDRSFYLPTIVRVLHSSPTSRILSRVTVDESTLFINRNIDQALFTIPETSAKIVTDIDTIENPFEDKPISSSVIFKRISLIVLGLIMITIALYRLYVGKCKK